MEQLIAKQWLRVATKLIQYKNRNKKVNIRILFHFQTIIIKYKNMYCINKYNYINI